MGDLEKRMLSTVNLSFQHLTTKPVSLSMASDRKAVTVQEAIDWGLQMRESARILNEAADLVFQSIDDTGRKCELEYITKLVDGELEYTSVADGGVPKYEARIHELRLELGLPVLSEIIHYLSNKELVRIWKDRIKVVEYCTGKVGDEKLVYKMRTDDRELVRVTQNKREEDARNK